jgi:hypothetical protein
MYSDIYHSNQRMVGMSELQFRCSLVQHSLVQEPPLRMFLLLTFLLLLLVRAKVWSM